MEDLSDSANRTIILIVFIGYILYLKYIETQLKIKKNVKKIKCDPLQMMIGGLIDGDEAYNTFNQCMEYSSQNDLLNYNNKTMKKYNDNLSIKLKEIEEKIENNKKLNENEKKQLKEFVENKYSLMNNLVERQQEMNETIMNTSGNLSDLTGLIKDNVSKLKDVFSSFKNSALLTDLKASSTQSSSTATS